MARIDYSGAREFLRDEQARASARAAVINGSRYSQAAWRKRWGCKPEVWRAVVAIMRARAERAAGRVIAEQVRHGVPPGRILAEAERRAAQRKAVADAAVYGRTVAALSQLDVRYRRSQSSWAGGEHLVSVGFIPAGEQPRCKGWTTKAWSKNRKWKGTNSEHRYWISADWIDRIAGAGMAEVGGMVCLDAVPLVDPPGGCAAWEVVLAKQAAGVSIVPVRRIAVRFGGRMAVGATATSAKAAIVKALQKELAYG